MGENGNYEESKDRCFEDRSEPGTGGRIRHGGPDGVFGDEVGAGVYADYAKPDGFCDKAWKAICQYVFAQAHKAGNCLFYYGKLIMVSCVGRMK